MCFASTSPMEVFYPKDSPSGDSQSKPSCLPSVETLHLAKMECCSTLELFLWLVPLHPHRVSRDGAGYESQPGAWCYDNVGHIKK